MPGGLLVLTLGLALYYFNFVWYPTPVVTAKLLKVLSEMPIGSNLDAEVQEKALQEVS